MAKPAVAKNLTSRIRERRVQLRKLSDSITEDAARDLIRRGKDNARTGEIDSAIDRATNRYAITEDHILRELATIAFANIGDYINDDGTVVPFRMLTPNQTAAIADITVSEFSTGRGEDARECRSVRIKLNDKQQALRTLGQHIGMNFDGPGTLQAQNVEPPRRIEYIVVDPQNQDNSRRGTGQDAPAIEYHVVD